jgi:hypothetical protein
LSIFQNYFFSEISNFVDDFFQKNQQIATENQKKGRKTDEKLDEKNLNAMLGRPTKDNGVCGMWYGVYLV